MTIAGIAINDSSQFTPLLGIQHHSKYNSLFLRSSGFPFFTDATTISPTAASGSLLRRAPKPYGSMMKSDLAPLLSAQLRTAPTGRPRVRRNLLPAPPAPDHMQVLCKNMLKSLMRETMRTALGHFGGGTRRGAVRSRTETGKRRAETVSTLVLIGRFEPIPPRTPDDNDTTCNFYP